MASHQRLADMERAARAASAGKARVGKLLKRRITQRHGGDASGAGGGDEVEGRVQAAQAMLA